MDKNIKVEEEVWKSLNQEKLEEGYSKISELVKNKIDFVKKFGDEVQFSAWFEDNYALFGFSKIIEKRKRGFPDFKMEMDGNIMEVELETVASNFIRHGHDPSKVDLVICLLNDRKLQVKTIEIEKFIYVLRNHLMINFSGNENEMEMVENWKRTILGKFGNGGITERIKKMIKDDLEVLKNEL